MTLAESVGMDTNSKEFLLFCAEIHEAKKKPRQEIRRFIESQPESRREAVRAHFNKWDKARRA